MDEITQLRAMRQQLAAALAVADTLIAERDRADRGLDAWADEREADERRRLACVAMHGEEPAF